MPSRWRFGRSHIRILLESLIIFAVRIWPLASLTFIISKRDTTVLMSRQNVRVVCIPWIVVFTRTHVTRDTYHSHIRAWRGDRRKHTRKPTLVLEYST